MSTTEHRMDMEEPEFSFRHLVKDTRDTIARVLRQWKLIGCFVLAGAVVGILYASLKTKTYTAKLTFVVEDAKSSGGSLSSLAGQLGFDIGGLGGGSGIIGGDNVLELLKSPHFIKKTLLTAYGDSVGNNGKEMTLADKYAMAYGLKEQWKQNKRIQKDIDFGGLNNKPARLEDSLLQTLVTRIADKELTIAKPDKKLAIFELDATMREEKLTQFFCERLLQITTDFYVDTKVSRLKRNVDRLQHRADSINRILNRQTYVSSSENEKLIDVNPAYASSGVTAEISAREKLVLSSIYAEVEKNLEISKTALIQETPTVQIIDHPELPLKVNKVKWGMSIIGGMCFGFLLIFFLLTFFRKETPPNS